MIYLSHVLNRPVKDGAGRKCGTVNDLYIQPGESFPAITALVIKPSVPFGPQAAETVVPWDQVRNLEDSTIGLKHPLAEIIPYESGPSELRIARDILDHQMVDTHGLRIVKVNDLKLAQIKGTVRLIGADIGSLGFFRRLGVEKPMAALSRVLPLNMRERLITWNYVEPLEQEPQNLKLRVPYAKLSELHPADIADVIEQLSVEEGASVFGALKEETAADILPELVPEWQATMLEYLEPERAAHLLGRLSPDDAADLLAHLPDEHQQELLALMRQADAAEVEELLKYDEKTAGGIMTTEVTEIPRDITIGATLERLRATERTSEMIYYLYVVDEDERLVGVLSLRDLVRAAPATLVEDVMDEDVIRVHVNDDQEDVAKVISKYDLLAVPVVDDNDTLLGIVTVDDIIDVLTEEAAEDISQITGAPAGEVSLGQSTWRIIFQRLSWLAAGIAGGLVSGELVAQLLGINPRNCEHPPAIGCFPVPQELQMMYFVPVVLILASGVGAQTLGAFSRAGAGDEPPHILSLLWTEVVLGLGVGLIGGVIVGVVAIPLWQVPRQLPLVAGASVALASLLAALLGTLLPWVLQKLPRGGGWISAPVLDAAISVVSLAVYLGIARVLL